MSEEPKRPKLTAAEVELMTEVLAGASPSLRQVGDRVAKGELVSQADVDELADFLMDAMDYTEEDGLTARALQIDDIIAVVFQMSQDFFR